MRKLAAFLTFGIMAWAGVVEAQAPRPSIANSQWVVIAVFDPANPNKPLALIGNSLGQLVVEVGGGSITISGPVNQGTSGVDADGWNFLLRDPSGALFGVSGNTLFSAIEDAGGDALDIGPSGEVFVRDVGGLQLALESTQASVLANVGGLNTNSRTVGVGFFMEGNRAEGAAIENPVAIAGKDSSGNRDAIETDDNGRMKVIQDTLPTGASTSALQTTGNTSLNQLDASVTILINQGAVSRVGFISDGTGTLLESKFGKIEQNTTDPVTLNIGIASTRIIVTNVSVIGDGNTNVTFKSNATAQTGDVPVTKNSGYAPGFDPTGHFRALSGEALVLQTSSSTRISGWYKYLEVPD